MNEKLAIALVLITEIRDGISNEKQTCECCGMVKFADWNNHQMRENLNAAITRLERVMKRNELETNI